MIYTLSVLTGSYHCPPTVTIKLCQEIPEYGFMTMLSYQTHTYNQTNKLSNYELTLTLVANRDTVNFYPI